LTPRDRLAAVLAPGAVNALEELVDELVSERLAGHNANGDGSPWLSLEEAAEYLRVSLRTLERQLARGRIRSSEIGRRRLLHRNDLDELAKAATREDVAPTTPPRRRARTLDRDRRGA
jgi:excisionase family DNA binding protein